MRYDPADSQLFVYNRSRLSAMLKPNSMAILDSNDLMPTNADGTLPWRQNSDLYYLSGIDQEESTLLLFPDAVEEIDREILFIKETSEHIAIWEGEKLSQQITPSYPAFLMSSGTVSSTPFWNVSLSKLSIFTSMQMSTHELT